MKNNFLIISLSLTIVVLLGVLTYPQIKDFLIKVDKDDLQSYSVRFDSSAEPQKDLETAMIRAKKEGKNILLEVGGDWCKWCGIYEGYLEDNPDVESAFYNNFEVVRVYFGKGMSKKSKQFLKRFPDVKATPHFFVLDENGKMIHSQNTSVLEQGYGYNKKLLMKFLTKYKK